MTENQLLGVISEYFKTKIFDNHEIDSSKIHLKLKNYKITPIVVKYLSKVLKNEFTPIGIAKALYFPRILGASTTASFWTRIQTMFVELELAKDSLIKGMDIEFIDKVDGRKKWCQLKSGPNTINSEDVKPLLKKFSTVTYPARPYIVDRDNSDLIVGILYGEKYQLSQQYKKINKRFPVIIGKEFWCRLTGFSEFYDKLVSNLGEMILKLDTEDFFKKEYKALAKEIEDFGLFDFKR